MKAKINIVSRILVPSLILFAALNSRAQSQQAPQKFSLHVVRDVNGQEEVISKTFSSKAEMEAFMKQNNMNTPVLNDIPATAMADSLSGKMPHRTRKIVIIETNDDADVAEARKNEPGREEDIKIMSIGRDENKQEVLKENGNKEISIICTGKIDHNGIANEAKAGEELHTAIEEPAPGLNNVKIYPNPSQGQFHISFNLVEPGAISIRIVDGQGKEMCSQLIDNYKGQFEKDIDASAFASGIYSVEVKTGSEIKTAMVIKQ
jgi:hypothetical protein